MCRVDDLEPHIKLPDKHGGAKVCTKGKYLQVTLLSVTAFARGSDTKTPITFRPCHILPFKNEEIQESETEVLMADADLQLHSYYDMLEGRSREIIIWQAYLCPQERQSKKTAAKTIKSTSKTITIYGSKHSTILSYVTGYSAGYITENSTGITQLGDGNRLPVTIRN